LGIRSDWHPGTSPRAAIVWGQTGPAPKGDPGPPGLTIARSGELLGLVVPPLAIHGLGQDGHGGREPGHVSDLAERLEPPPELPLGRLGIIGGQFHPVGDLRQRPGDPHGQLDLLRMVMAGAMGRAPPRCSLGPGMYRAPPPCGLRTNRLANNRLQPLRCRPPWVAGVNLVVVPTTRIALLEDEGVQLLDRGALGRIGPTCMIWAHSPSSSPSFEPLEPQPAEGGEVLPATPPQQRSDRSAWRSPLGTGRSSWTTSRRPCDPRGNRTCLPSTTAPQRQQLARRGKNSPNDLVPVNQVWSSSRLRRHGLANLEALTGASFSDIGR